MGYISFRSTCSSKNGTFFVATCLAEKLQIFHNEKRKRKERDLILILPQNSIRYILFSAYNTLKKYIFEINVIRNAIIITMYFKYNAEKLFFQETQ